MPMPSKSRTQKWATGRSGSHIASIPKRKDADTPFMIERRQILERDLWRCFMCGGYGKLIHPKEKRCICSTCLGR
jgi:hypothetical protein